MTATARYRKKPVVVEARRLDMSDYDGACEVLKWCGGRAVDFGPYVAVIPTLEGEMFVQDGDWIHPGRKGRVLSVSRGHLRDDV